MLKPVKPAFCNVLYLVFVFSGFKIEGSFLGLSRVRIDEIRLEEQRLILRFEEDLAPM
jgi:hypothetical protein